MRRLGSVLTAVEAQKKELIELATGESHTVAKGDWIIYRGQAVLDAATTDELLTHYDLVDDQHLVLDQAACTLLERTTGVGSTRNPSEFVKAVERLASIRIGDVRIEFTPGQLTELAHRAQKRGITIEQEIARVVDRIKDEIFYRS